MVQGVYDFKDRVSRYQHRPPYILDTALFYSPLSKSIVCARFTIIDAAPQEPTVDRVGSGWTYSARTEYSDLQSIINGVTSNELTQQFLPALPHAVAFNGSWSSKPEWLHRQAFFKQGRSAHVLTITGDFGFAFEKPEIFAAVREQVEISPVFSFENLRVSMNFRHAITAPDAKVIIPFEFELPLAIDAATSSSKTVSVRVATTALTDAGKTTVLVQQANGFRAIAATPLSDVSTGKIVERTYLAEFQEIRDAPLARLIYDELPVAVEHCTPESTRSDPVPVREANLRFPSTQSIQQTSTDEFFSDDDWASIYTVKAELGRGGFGKVMLVEDQFRTQAALKVLFDKHIDAERLSKEIVALREIQSKYVIDIRQAARDMSWYTMDVADSDLDRRFPEMFIGDCYAAIVDLTQALADVHRAKLIHRDVSPRNLLWFQHKFPHWRLSDLGLVRRFPGETTRVITRTQVGTRLYMSPEANKDIHNVDLRTDLYSLGKIVEWLITGRDPVPQQKAELRGPWSSLLSSLTATDRDDRPESAEVVLEELRRLHGSLLQAERQTGIDAMTALTRAELQVLQYLLMSGPSATTKLHEEGPRQLTGIGIAVAVEKLVRKSLVTRVLRQDINGIQVDIVELTESGKNVAIERILDDDIYVQGG